MQSEQKFIPEAINHPNPGEITLESADILRLVAAHLTESGLSQAVRVLREESGIGSAGCTRAVHSNLKQWASRGEWGNILESLATLDKRRCGGDKLQVLLADVHEMAILELADMGEMQLAYSALRLVEDDLEQLPADDSLDEQAQGSSKSKSKTGNEYMLTRKRDLEQRLAALVSLRNTNGNQSEKSEGKTLPPDFYGETSKQERRDDIGARLVDSIPVLPPARLTSLLQQAIKWQSHTGQLPRIQNHWDEDETITEKIDMSDTEEQKRPPKRKKKAFDLVLGDVEIDPISVGETPATDAVPWDPIPTKPYTTIKFGKKATAESAIFSPDLDDSGVPLATSFSLITGSSDGLVEIYDAHNKYASLRMDLPYQEKDELMGHDDSAVLALASSNDGSMLATGSGDGEVKVWRISTGKCLRRIQAHDGSAISCLSFSPDGTHLLTGSQDSNCREFGLRTSRMLKEFHGHSSYIHTCQYVFRKGGHQLNVVTSSADGTVRIWDAKTSEVVRVLRPISLGESLTGAGASAVVDHRSDLTSGAGGCPAIHTVLCLHTPDDTMIIVPRGLRAFLINFHGMVIRTFEDNISAGGKVFVAATVSPSNHWLYCITEDGVCCVFDILTSKLEKSIRNFGEETTSKSKDGGKLMAEISGVVHHPHKGVLAAFSNDKGQKKGQLVLWK